MRLTVGKLAIAGVALSLAVGAGLSRGQSITDNETLINPSDIQWNSAPDGAKAAVLHGDPGKPGPFVMRVMIPARAKVMPHWHSQDEYITDRKSVV